MYVVGLEENKKPFFEHKYVSSYYWEYMLWYIQI